MIETNWGGTRIEPWSTPEGLASCGVEPHEDPDRPVSMFTTFFHVTVVGVKISWSVCP
jgi:hypothetical protein